MQLSKENTLGLVKLLDDNVDLSVKERILHAPFISTTRVGL